MTKKKKYTYVVCRHGYFFYTSGEFNKVYLQNIDCKKCENKNLVCDATARLSIIETGILLINEED